MGARNPRHVACVERAREWSTFLYAAGHKEEAVGFTEGVHFVWLTTAAEHVRAELVALATMIRGKLR